MTLRLAVFVERDHRDVIVRSWVRPLTDDKNRSFRASAAAMLSNMRKAVPNAELVGICHEGLRQRFDAEAIARLLGRSRRGRSSPVFLHLQGGSWPFIASGRGEVLNGVTGMAAPRQQTPSKGLRLFGSDKTSWYVNASDIPGRAQGRFRLHSFVYRDQRDDSFGQCAVFLPEAPERALAAFVASETWWEPVALIEGRTRAEFLSDRRGSHPEGPPLQAGEPDDGDRSDIDAEDDVDHGPRGHGFGRTEEPASSPRQSATATEVADTLAELLVRFAIEAFVASDDGQGDGQAAVPGEAISRFRVFLLEKRPLILIETAHAELAANIANIIASIAGLATRVERHSLHDMGEARIERGRGRVVLFDKPMLEQGLNENDKTLDNRLRALARQGDLGLVVTDSICALPAALRFNRDLELRLPDIVGPVRAAVLTALFGPDARSNLEDDTWSRYASALDFEKVAYAHVKGTQAVRDLAERVRGRLQRMGATKGLRLVDIHGLGAAKHQAEMLIADMEAYLAGRIPWSEVDRGMLLVGPPGTGKTMLAKAVSKETGIRFIHASASEWQASSHLGEHIQSIRNSFSLARRYAPSILFIDEFDSIGRRGHGGQNEFYHTAVVNCVLEELQGFEEREGVVVVAATNRMDGVDPALRRAGRLDRVVEVHFPTIEALEKIYGYYISEQKRLGLDHGSLELGELARLTFGQTGADVELYVRGAARRARMRAGRGEPGRILQDDFVAEIMKSPVGESGAVRLTPEEMRRTAIHEAGHALMQLTGPDRGKTISYLSITPRADGTLGFVFSAPDGRHTRTREDLREMVRVLLGGRAAESVVYGEGHVSSGSGGPSLGADLAQATNLVTAMATQYGFSRRGGLVWQRTHDKLPHRMQAELKRELDRLYGDTVRRVQLNRRLLNRIVKTLLARQEITGAELRTLLGRR